MSLISYMMALHNCIRTLYFVNVFIIMMAFVNVFVVMALLEVKILNLSILHVHTL